MLNNPAMHMVCTAPHRGDQTRMVTYLQQKARCALAASAAARGWVAEEYATEARLYTTAADGLIKHINEKGNY